MEIECERDGVRDRTWRTSGGAKERHQDGIEVKRRNEKIGFVPEVNATLRAM
jgi:hypothetical protein